MVCHMTLREERYRDAPSCIRAVRANIEAGWHIVEISGSDCGPLRVVYAMTRENTGGEGNVWPDR